MSKSFAGSGIGSIEGLAIAHLLGVEPNDLDNQTRYSMLREIVDHYKNHPNPRYEILKVLSKKKGDSVEAVWNYVALKKEKEAAVRSLNPEHFEKDIAEEIVKGDIRHDQIRRIRNDIARQKKEAQKKAAQEQKFKEKTDKALEKVNSLLPVEEIDDALSVIESINKRLI